MAHAQQMPPDVVQSFLDNGITGYDFPELLQNNGALLEQELGITRLSLRRRLLRGMRMKLLGMGNHPAAPELLTLASLPPASAAAASGLHSQSLNDEGGKRQSCELPTVLIQWGSGDMHLPDFLANNEMDFPVHKYQLYRERSGGSSDPLIQQRTLMGKDELIYEGMEMFYKDHLPVVLSSHSDVVTYSYRLVAWNVIGRSEYTIFEHTVPQLSSECLLKLSVAHPFAVKLSPPQIAEQDRSWEDNVSLDVSHKQSITRKGADASAREARALHLNDIITPLSQDRNDDSSVKGEAGITPNISIVNQLFLILTTAYHLLSYFYSALKYSFMAVSFTLSFVFTVMRVKSLVMYNKAMLRENTAGGGDPARGGILDVVLVYLQHLEPCCRWLQRKVLSPVLKSFVPFLTRQLDALAMTSPFCQPMATVVVEFFRLVEEKVLDPKPFAVDVRPVRPAGLLASRNQESQRTISTNSAASGDNYAMDDDQDYHQCYLCGFAVTDKMPKNGKRKRHKCSRCTNIFCKKCGTVDHKMFQCKVGGKCICRNCFPQDSKHVIEKTRRHSISSTDGIGGHMNMQSSQGIGDDNTDILSFTNECKDGGGEGSMQSSNCSSRSSSPGPDHISAEVCRVAPPVSTPESQRGRPPRHMSGGGTEKHFSKLNVSLKAAARGGSATSKFSFSMFGIRNKTPSPPPASKRQISEPIPPSAKSNDIPELTRSSTSPDHDLHS